MLFEGFFVGVGPVEEILLLLIHIFYTLLLLLLLLGRLYNVNARIDVIINSHFVYLLLFLLIGLLLLFFGLLLGGLDLFDLFGAVLLSQQLLPQVIRFLY